MCSSLAYYILLVTHRRGKMNTQYMSKLKPDANIFLLRPTTIHLQLTVNFIITILHAFHFLLPKETQNFWRHSWRRMKLFRKMWPRRLLVYLFSVDLVKNETGQMLRYVISFHLRMLFIQLYLSNSFLYGHAACLSVWAANTAIKLFTILVVILPAKSKWKDGYRLDF